MLDELHPLRTQDIIYVDKIGMARIRHTMIGNKYDIHNLGEITGH